MTGGHYARRSGRPSIDSAHMDAERAGYDAFEAVKRCLRNAFSVADSEYELASADDIRHRALARDKS